MAKRRIMTGDAECLYKVCRKVDNFDKRLAVLLDDMAETMYDAEGVGPVSYTHLTLPTIA
mgnify:CR=1 FL=1